MESLTASSVTLRISLQQPEWNQNVTPAKDLVAVKYRDKVMN